MRKFIYLLAFLCILFAAEVPQAVYAWGSHEIFGDSVDYAQNDEWWSQLGYDGYIQFDSKYDSSYWGGTVGAGYINYVRDGESVSGGRQYAERQSGSFFSTSTSVSDSLNPFASKTRFYYDFILHYEPGDSNIV